ncbi:hypothetical protein E4T48_04136 [Aureobasidium sp. EXF-10727]|nr:hypothetical protein E4T48_04136 [Aureobasidium sp. EXF-10727]
MFPEPQTPVIRETVNISSKHFGTVVTIEVGPEKKAFVIHKGLLCFYSDYFRAAFNGSFKEAIEAKLSLREESADLFYIVNGFFYTNQLRRDDQIGSQLHLTTLGDLWVLGDRYLMPALQNTAMDAYIRKISGQHGHGSPESIERRYRQTHAGSPLRRVFVDWQAHKLKLNKKILREWPKEALADFAIALFDMKSKHQGTSKLPSPEERDKCFYHVHAEGEHCEV